jgi:hypothetical protein
MVKPNRRKQAMTRRAKRQQFVDEMDEEVFVDEMGDEVGRRLTEGEETRELVASIIRQMPEEAVSELFDRLLRGNLRSVYTGPLEEPSA